jgi:hypothetical protein
VKFNRSKTRQKKIARTSEEISYHINNNNNKRKTKKNKTKKIV